MINAFLTLLLLLPTTLLGEAESVPKYLYKIVSGHNWSESQARPVLKLSSLDDNFIHLATESDIGRILEKYWSGHQEVVILKLDQPRRGQQVLPPLQWHNSEGSGSGIKNPAQRSIRCIFKLLIAPKSISQ